MTHVAEKLLVPNDHPHAEFLRGCSETHWLDSLSPAWSVNSAQLTENAESHAVEVFAKILRNLLLQPPVQGRRVMASIQASRAVARLPCSTSLEICLITPSCI